MKPNGHQKVLVYEDTLKILATSGGGSYLQMYCIKIASDMHKTQWLQLKV
jgi:hypothetical protein